MRRIASWIADWSYAEAADRVPLIVRLHGNQIGDTFPCHGRAVQDAVLAVLIRQVRTAGLGMVMKNLLAIVSAASMITAAAAQPMAVPGPEAGASAFGPDPIIQITTTFRARIEGSADPRDVPSPTAQDTARRTLYNMAAKECTLLAEFWKADCRLNSFYVSMDGMVGPEGRAELPSMFGTAIYELRSLLQGH